MEMKKLFHFHGFSERSPCMEF